jgi:hypothetical protein
MLNLLIFDDTSKQETSHDISEIEDVTEPEKD